MSNKPDLEWREKGLSLAVWGEGESATYQLQKSFKRKGSDQWERQSIRLFFNELENLGGLVMKALNASYGKAQISEHIEHKANAYAPKEPEPVQQGFDDDSIPF